VADTTNRDDLLTVNREGIPNRVEVEDGVRAIWLEYVDRATRADWAACEVWEAGRAAMADARARFGRVGIQALYVCERRTYALLVDTPAADDMNRERRRARREELHRERERAAEAAHASCSAPGT